MLYHRLQSDDLEHIELLRAEIERHCKEGAIH